MIFPLWVDFVPKTGTAKYMPIKGRLSMPKMGLKYDYPKKHSDKEKIMRSTELLLQCQVKLKADTEYKLAKALKIPTQRIYDYMAGRRTPNAYAAVKIAECLGLDPLGLIAEFEEMTAKNPEERSFWADFRVRAEKPLKGFIMALICIATLLTGQGQPNNAAGVFRRLKHA